MIVAVLPRFLAVTAALWLSGCSVLGDIYNGGYSMQCPFSDDQQVRAEAMQVAEALSSRFGQPVSIRRNAPDGLIMDIPVSAPEPSGQLAQASLTIQRQTLRDNSRFSVGVGKMGTAPNAATEKARAAIDEVLQGSHCTKGSFHVSYGSLAH